MRKISAPTRRFWALLAAAGLCAAANAHADSQPARLAADALPATPRFVDATGAAGLDHEYGGEEAFVVGGGVAALDCDQDGRLDLFIAGGAHEAALYQNRSEPGAPIRLSPARDIAAALGVAPALTRRVTGAYPLDVDGDGRDDLLVLRFGRNLLLRGLGACRFEEASAAYNLPQREDWTAAAAAIWRGADALPTLAIGNYVDRARPLDKTGNCEASYVIAPDPADPQRYGAPIELAPVGCALSMLFVDWSGEGVADLRVSNDREYADPERGEQLFRLLDVDGGLVATPFGAGDGWDEPRIWGMGLAAEDITGDGLPEIAATNMADNRLDTLILGGESGPRAPRFENKSYDWGAMSQRPYVGGDPRPSTSWHVAFEDLNNDQALDLWIVKGNVDAMPQFAAFDPDSLLLGLPEGGFREAGFEAGLALPTKGRGGVAADLNADGALDLVTVNRDQPTRVMQAIPLGRGANWVAIDLRQDAPNARAIGAVIEIETTTARQRRTRVVGGGHASGHLGPLHFGLGADAQARVRVIWPDGRVGSWRAVTANQRLVIDRTGETGR